MAKNSPLTSTKWARVFDAINHLTMVIDRENNIIQANKATLNALGLTQEQISQRKCYELFHSADAPPASCPMRALLQQGEQPHAVTQEIKALGKQYMVSCSPILDKQGRFEFAVHGAFEITSHKLMEQELRDSELRFRTLAEQSLVAILLFQDNRITFANPVSEKMTGYSLDEMLSWGALEFVDHIHPDDRQMALENFQRRISGDPAIPSVYTLRVVRRTGSTGWYTMHASRIELQGKPAVLASLVDVTESKLAEQALRQSEQRVREKLRTIVEPEGDIGELELSDIIDTEAIQALMTDFFFLTQIGVAIVDLSGKVLVATGWQGICTDFHRIHPETSRFCVESDIELSKGVRSGEFKLYRCKNNMWDIATPIEVGGRHVGNLFLGQFLFKDEVPDFERFRAQARRYGFDESEYLAALDRVPRWSRETIDSVMRFYSKFSQLVSSLSYSNIKLSRAFAERDALFDGLRASEERFRVAAAVASDMIYERDLSSGEAQFYGDIDAPHGLRPGEFPRNIRDAAGLLHPDDLEIVVKALGAMAENNAPFDLEYRLRGAEGGYVYWHDRGVLINDAAGKPIKIIGAMTDITARKRAEQALRESEARYKSIFECSSSAIWVEDFSAVKQRLDDLRGNGVIDLRDYLEGNPTELVRLASLVRIIDVNERSLELMGARTKDDLHKNLISFFTLESLQIFKDEMVALAAGQTRFSCEIPVLNVHGDCLDLLLQLEVVAGFETDLSRVIVSFVDITALKRSQAELRESEEKFAQAFRTSPYSITVTRLSDGAFIEANAAFYAMTGFTPQETLSSDTLTMNLWANREDRDQVVRDLLAGERVVDREYLVRKKDGNIVVGRFSAGLFSIQDNKYIICSIDDITERKHAEQALQESEERFRLLLHNANDAVYIHEVSPEKPGRFIEVNEQACRMLGYTREEFLAMEIGQIDVPEQAARLPRVLGELFRTGRVVFETEHLTKDGRRVPVEVSTRRFEFRGQPMVFSLVRDITERKHAEQALKESEEKFALAFNTSPYAIAISTLEDGKFIDVNDTFYSLTGFTPAETINNSALEMGIWVDREDRKAIMQELRARGKVSNREAKFRKKSGEVITGVFSGEIIRINADEFMLSSINDITERKRAEQALKESEERFATAFKDSPYAITISHPVDGTFVELNDAFYFITGYNRDEALNQTSFNLGIWVNLEDRDRMSAELRAGRRIDGWELLFRKKNGEIITGLFSADLIHIQNQTYILSSINDISERKQREERIRLNEARLQSLYEISQHDDTDIQKLLDFTLNKAIELTDSKVGYIYYYNEERRQFVLNSWSKNVMPQCSVAHPPTIYELDKTGIWGEAVRQRKPVIVNDFAAPNPLKKGYPPGHVELHNFLTIPIFENQRIVAVVGVGNKAGDYDESDVRQLTLLMDTAWKIVQRRRSELALRESEERFRAIAEQMTDIVFVTDLTGKISFLSPAAELLFSRPLDQMIGHHFTEFLAEDTIDQTVAAFTAAVENRQPVRTLELTMKRADGTLIWGELTGSQFTVNDVEGTLGVIRDVTERRKLEEQLRQSQKMEAVGRLAGGIAHDFNNILTAIQGFSDMALDKLAPDDPLRRDLQEILNAADSAAALTRQLLTFSRKQIVAPRVIDLNSSLAHGERMLRRVIGENIELLFKPSADLWSVRVDPVQFDQVLINLAVNARDAMPETGNLIVETANVNLDLESCPVCGENFGGEYAMLAISDTGCGIRPELLGQIFEPFFTTKDTGKGTGLGLPTVQGIVHQAGGHVTVYSEPGLGATFKLYFPRIQAAPDRVAAQQPALALSGRETILLVEDQEQVRRLACRALRDKGYNVIEAALPSQALLLAQGHNGPIDLLLTDVIMPEMNGKQLHQRLLETRPGQPVLFMSGYTEDVIAHHGMLEPGIDFLQKPFRTDDLLLAVRRTLATTVTNKPIELKGSDVLLIEDEENVRLIIKLMLERDGCRVLEASSGQEAMRLFSERATAPALVLLDLGLPDLPGEQVLEQMLAQRADQRVLLMSGYSHNELPAGLLDRPTLSFIQKPFKRELLIEALKKLLKA